jgi:hypothetical protein
MRDPARCREALPHEVPVARDPAMAVKRGGGGACDDLAGWRIHPRQGSTRLQNHSFGRLLVECWCLDAATCFSLFVLSDLGSLCVCCTGGEPYPVSWCLAMASRQSRDLEECVRFSTEFESGARETAHTFMDVCQECWEHFLL